MNKTKKTNVVISTLEEMQQSGITLDEAIKLLHQKNKIPFDDIWPAVMVIRQVSEREAMQLTKDWCL